MYRIGESFRSGFGMKLKTRQVEKKKKSASFERVPVAWIFFRSLEIGENQGFEPIGCQSRKKCTFFSD
jgi:hypothetical protein